MTDSLQPLTLHSGDCLRRIVETKRDVTLTKIFRGLPILAEAPTYNLTGKKLLKTLPPEGNRIFNQ